MQRGRKSTASLSVVTPETTKRPEPPNILSKEQKAEWRKIVARLPVDWFPEEMHSLLVQYLEHWQTIKTLNKTIRSFTPAQIKTDPEAHQKIINMRGRESALMLQLARSFRMTQQSRWQPSTAASKTKSKSTSGGKPWQQIG